MMGKGKRVLSDAEMRRRAEYATEDGDSMCLLPGSVISILDRLTLLEAVAKAARENRDTDEAYSADYDRAGGISAELCIRRAQTQVALMVALAALDGETTDAH